MRARELGLSFGTVTTGACNAITDVDGVRVGHATVEAPGIRTGVTAVVPPGEDLLHDPVRAATFVANGHTKAVGLHQIDELGQLETPILLTGTLSTFGVADALVRWILSQPGSAGARSVNAVVAETNDARWGATPAPVVGHDAVFAALAGATDGPVEEGSVGAGTGVVAFGFKAGIGTSSRVVASGTVGVLVQSNHAGRLVIDGRAAEPLEREDQPGSIVVVVATSAPADARQLGRLARRAGFALARTGSSYAGRSGEVVLAFSTHRAASADRVGDTELEDLWIAVQDAVDEAVLNSLTTADDAVGRALGLS